MFKYLISGRLFNSDCNKESCKIDQQLQSILLQEFLPSFVEVSGIRIPFALFECYKAYDTSYTNKIELLLLNRCKDFMITGDKNRNKAGFVLNDETESKLLENCRNWDEFSTYKDEKRIKNDIEKLLYQLNELSVTEWNVTALDRLICEIKWKEKYGDYLRASSEYRNFHDTITTKEASSIHILDVKNDVKFDEQDKASLHNVQIYQMTITVGGNDAQNLHLKEEKKNDEERDAYIEKVF